MRNNTISTREAIKRGRLVLTVPGMTIMFGTMIGLWFLVAKDIIPFYFGPLGLIIGAILGSLFVCFTMASWRIWSYHRVENLREFKEEAVHAGLIFRNNSSLINLEIRSNRQKMLIQELESNHKKRPQYYKFQDDPSIPSKIEFHYSKLALILKMAIAIFSIAFGIFILSTVEISQKISLTISGIILLGVGIFVSYKSYLKLINNVATLVLSEEGITIDDRTTNWQEISSETAKIEGLGKYSRPYLVFDTEEEIIELPLEEYDINLAELRRLLKIYRGRNTIMTTRSKLVLP